MFSPGTNIKRESPNTYAAHLKTGEGQRRNVMAVSFQFAFLGPNHNYFAAVTKTTVKGGCPLEASDICFYGLPRSFEERIEKLAKTQYLYNIRGHDFLSYMGQLTNLKNQAVPLSANGVIYGEIAELSKLAQQDAQKFSRRADIITSFGPHPGSFFADAFRLNRYRWSNLPADLEDKIQEHVSLYGYGNQKTWQENKIHDVAINAVGGWIMQLKRGARFIWSQGEGLLPNELQDALAEGERKRLTISKLFLNHQAPTEYVLIFSEGQAYLRLHHNFERKVRVMLEKWADDRKKALQWKFASSCSCTETEQSQKDAIYYSKRGLFYLRRDNAELACQYLREAHHQDWNDVQIRENYAKALVALRRDRKCPILEGHLERGERLPPAGASDSNADFRDQYIYMLTTIRSLNGRRTEDRRNQEEWSWYAEGVMCCPRLPEMDSSNTSGSVSRILSYELPANQEM